MLPCCFTHCRDLILQYKYLIDEHFYIWIAIEDKGYSVPEKLCFLLEFCNRSLLSNLLKTIFTLSHFHCLAAKTLSWAQCFCLQDLYDIIIYQKCNKLCRDVIALRSLNPQKIWDFVGAMPAHNSATFFQIQKSISLFKYHYILNEKIRRGSLLLNNWTVGCIFIIHLNYQIF